MNPWQPFPAAFGGPRELDLQSGIRSTDTLTGWRRRIGRVLLIPQCDWCPAVAQIRPDPPESHLNTVRLLRASVAQGQLRKPASQQCVLYCSSATFAIHTGGWKLHFPQQIPTETSVLACVMWGGGLNWDIKGQKSERFNVICQTRHTRHRERQKTWETNREEKEMNRGTGCYRLGHEISSRLRKKLKLAWCELVAASILAN